MYIPRYKKEREKHRSILFDKKRLYEPQKNYKLVDYYDLAVQWTESYYAIRKIIVGPQ